MKQLICLFLAFILMQSCTAPENNSVTYKGTTYLLEKDSDQEKLIQAISALLPENEFNNGLQHFSIRKGIDDAIEEEYTYLFSESQNKLFRMAVIVEYDTDEKTFTIPEQLFVMCYGTTDGNPEQYNKNWFCHSPYKKGEDNFKAKKTVTLVIEE